MAPIFLCIFFGLLSHLTDAEMTNFQAMVFLYRYGYISQRSMSRMSDMDTTEFQDTMNDAISRFQEYYGLDVTGKMSHETEELMEQPRCGVEDDIPFGPNTGESRKKRYVLQGSRWNAKYLKYRVNNYHSGQGWDLSSVQTQMEAVFQAWSDVTSLQFVNATSTQDRDVQIEIAFQSGAHGDGPMNGFDGPSGTLAHAFYPSGGLGGDVHFDDDERWSLDGQVRGPDFYSVALHEVGHALGLRHTPVRDAVMFAAYSRPKRQLHRDDVDGIQALYGRRQAAPATPERNPGSRAAGAPDLCSVSSVDAALNLPQVGVYVFKGKFCYLLQPDLRSTVSGYPQLITKEFPGMADVEQVDAAISWPNGQAFLFAGSRVWSFRQRALEGNTALNIADRFPGIPDNLLAAVFWPVDKRTYFFRNAEYWRYDNTSRNAVRRGFPRPITRWTGVVGPVDAALNINSSTYFFQGDKFYRYNDLQYRVDRDYPRDIRAMFGCTGVPRIEDDAGLVDVEVSPGCPEGDAGGEGFQGRRRSSTARGQVSNGQKSKAPIPFAAADVVVVISFLVALRNMA